MSVRLVVLSTLVVLIAACGSADAPSASSSAAPSARASAAPPADAKTVAAYRASDPKAGDKAKVHGFLGSVKGNDWVVIDKIGEVMPFVFCKMDAAPTGFEKDQRVVVEGTVEDNALLQKCTVTHL